MESSGFTERFALHDGLQLEGSLQLLYRVTVGIAFGPLTLFFCDFGSEDGAETERRRNW